MEKKFSHRTAGRFFFGFVLIGVGMLFLAHNLDFIYIDHISRYWPVLLILVGLAKLVEWDSQARHGSGLGWIVLGTWLLISLNGMWGFDFGNSWPILIVGWGVSMLWKALFSQPLLKPAEEAHDGN